MKNMTEKNLQDSFNIEWKRDSLFWCCVQKIYGNHYCEKFRVNNSPQILVVLLNYLDKNKEEKSSLHLMEQILITS